MKGTISNFRSSKHRQKDTHMIVMVEGIDSRDKAQKLIGKDAVYTTEAKKEIKGKVASVHGNKGAVRIVFEKGMPGQSLSRQVVIN